MTSPSSTELIGAALFALAVAHTLATKYFQRLAHAQPAHAGGWHLLGGVEVVFGFWAMVLVLFIFGLQGQAQAIQYLETCNFTEPLFVFAIMVVAGTRPVLQFAIQAVRSVAARLPLPSGMALTFTMLALLPLLGSFITEPAAMTIAALMLRDSVLNQPLSNRLKYATLGVLFVNVSIGGTLTPFAAPPVLMVAASWGWDMAFMLGTFGWKAAMAVVINASLLTVIFRQELRGLKMAPSQEAGVPSSVLVVHLLFLLGVVVFAHHPVVFMGLFLFFLGYTSAYQRYQSPLILREALLVAFFLAGLVVLGRLQAWWLQPLLSGMSADAVYFGATALTAVTDNAALTYLGSLLEAPSLDFKVALVAGAVTGGGLTLIANAPNPAGAAILKDCFEDGVISPLNLFLAALPPTLVAIVAFRCL